MSIGTEMKYFEISPSKKYLLGYLLWDIIIIKRQMIISIWKTLQQSYWNEESKRNDEKKGPKNHRLEVMVINKERSDFNSSDIPLEITSRKD